MMSRASSIRAFVILAALCLIAGSVFAQGPIGIRIDTVRPNAPSAVPPSVLARMGTPLKRNITIVQLTYNAYYVDTGAPVVGAAVNVTVQGADASGGHHHNPGNRPHGWVLTQAEYDADPDPAADIPADDGPSGAYDTDTYGMIVGANIPTEGGLTDSSGNMYIVYIAPEFSGTEMLTATLQLGSDPSSSVTYDIKTPGFVDLTTFTDFPWQSCGATAAHPNCFWVLPKTVTEIRAAANKFASDQMTDTTLQQAITELASYNLYDFPNNGPNSGLPIVPKTPVLFFVNDCSLPWGGLFDIGPTNQYPTGLYWAIPHKGHRNGKQVDIKTAHLVGAAIPLNVIANNNMPNAAIGDPRLVGSSGQSPFQNVPLATRKAMNVLVKQIQFRRLQLLHDALTAQNVGFIKEGAHFHANFP